MAPAEGKKKIKKLVVEETSAPEAPIEAIIEEDLPKEEVEKIEETEEVAEDIQEEPKEEVKETPVKRSVLLPKDIEEKNQRKTSFTEENPDSDDSKVNTFWVIALALFIIASLVGGGILVFRAGVEKGKLEAGSTTQGTPAPSESAAPSASPEVKREDLKIQVLNGTGKAGVAASAKEYLEGLGYKDVETGNASSSDFTETEIAVKDSKKAYLETLKADLSKEYTVSATTKTLSSSSEFDTTVTIGSK